jgi:dTDP-4-dehydrorhamnose reductase
MSELAPLLPVGAGGMLGRAFSALLTRERLQFAAGDLPEFDLADPDRVARALTPGVRTVLNCVAFTDVDGAEQREPEANAINGAGVGELARRCEELGAMLVHYSTDECWTATARGRIASSALLPAVRVDRRARMVAGRLLRRDRGASCRLPSRR